MGLCSALGRDGPGYSEHDLAVFNLSTQTVELRLFARVLPDEHRMKSDTAFLVALEAADGRDPTAVPHRRDHQVIKQGTVDERIGTLRNCLTDPLGELLTSPHHEVGPQLFDELIVIL
jgi:hypothetical protein